MVRRAAEPNEFDAGNVRGLRIAELEAENAALKTRVADLEAQLRTNSQNSSKPPSTDGPGKPAPRSLRRPSKRKPGGQDGHRGQTLAQVADPDAVIRHEPSGCRGCGSDLTGAAEVELLPPAGLRHPADQGARHRTPDHQPPLPLREDHHRDRPGRAAATVQYGPVCAPSSSTCSWDSSCPRNAPPSPSANCSASPCPTAPSPP